MPRHHRLSTLLSLALLGASVATHGATPMLTLDHTFCFGYHQIAVPADASTSIGQPVTYDNYTIRTHLRLWQVGYNKLITDDEQFHAPPYGDDGRIIRASRELFPGAQSVVTYMPYKPDSKSDQYVRKILGGVSYDTTAYLLLPPKNSTVYQIDYPGGFILKDGEQENLRLNRVLQEQAALLKRFAAREELEVPGPERKGVCIDGGFIADAGDGLGEHFFKTALAMVRYPRLPGVEMRLSVNVGTVKEGDYLFDRKPASFLAELIQAVKFRTLRKAEREVNGIHGQELLTGWKSGGGEQYLFLWESTENPRLKVEMSWGDEQNDGDQAVQAVSPLPAEQAMALWDATLATLQLRPVRP